MLVINLGTWNGVVKESPEQVIAKAKSAAIGQGLSIKSEMPGRSLTAEGGRAYNLVVLIILLLIGVIFGLIYYFTRPRTSFQVGVRERKDGKTEVTINSIGPKGDAALSALAGSLSPA